MLSSLGFHLGSDSPFLLFKWGHSCPAGPLAAPQPHWEHGMWPKESVRRSRGPRAAPSSLSLVSEPKAQFPHLWAGTMAVTSVGGGRARSRNAWLSGEVRPRKRWFSPPLPLPTWAPRGPPFPEAEGPPQSWLPSSAPLLAGRPGARRAKLGHQGVTLPPRTPPGPVSVHLHSTWETRARILGPVSVFLPCVPWSPPRAPCPLQL